MPATIITVASIKGGAGKTTLAVTVSDYWRRQGKRVTIIDTDPNQGSLRWFNELPEGLDIIGATGETVRHVIAQAEASSDIVVIDLAGAATRGMIVAMGMAHAVVIPTAPVLPEIINAAETAVCADDASAVARRPIPVGVVLTRFNPRETATADGRRQIEALSLNLLTSSLQNRAAIRRAVNAKVSPLEMGEAAVNNDVAELAGEILRLAKVA